VTFTPGISNLEGCGNSAGNAVWIDFASTTQPDGRSLYATIISAATTGATITMGVLGCADNNYLPLVYRVDMHL